MAPEEIQVVIVGAGHAGGTLAATLRQFGFQGGIKLVGEEEEAPYQRPPLSKAFLKGEATAESITLRPEEFYAVNNITMRRATRVTALDLVEHRIRLMNGESIPYKVLVLATGSRARKLTVSGAELGNIHELRTAADARALKVAIRAGEHIVIIGGGYVGLEVAASAVVLGARVTIIEKESRCLARVACEPLSTFFEQYHRARGVKIMTGVSVARFEGDGNGALIGVKLDNGQTIACQAAVVGVGAHACDELARAAKISCQNGIVVDLAGRTSVPGVFAIGDVTLRPLPHYDGHMVRLESVPNAQEQAKQVACAITGRAPPHPEVPWFWSDQYDIKFQIAGVPLDAEEMVIRGDPAVAKFAVFHLKDGRVLAVEAVNSAPEFIVGKQLIAAKTPIDRERLQDTNFPIRQIASSTSPV